MTELSRILPSHPDEGDPFIIEETISLYAAAMVYRERHPVSGHLKLANIQDPHHVKMLEDWICPRRKQRPPTSLRDIGVEREESDQERNWRICWEVYCELVAQINDDPAVIAHEARDEHGQIIPLACKIWTRVLLTLVRNRRDAGKTISALAEANSLNAPDPKIHKAIHAVYDEAAAAAEPQDAERTKEPDLEPLFGDELMQALEQKVENTWGPDFNDLPSRDELLSHFQKDPRLVNATDKDMRKLRAKYANEKSKRGGAAFHRSRRSQQPG